MEVLIGGDGEEGVSEVLEDVVEEEKELEDPTDWIEPIEHYVFFNMSNLFC